MNTPHAPERCALGGDVPVRRVSGNARACGETLGALWREALQARARAGDPRSVSMLGTPLIVRLFERHAPCLIDLHQGMAHGAGLAEADLKSVFAAGEAPAEGCTSFALQPAATLAGAPISGQTKDTPPDRIGRYEVLALSIRDGWNLLTLTYPGWLFGHGFLVGGCAIFRNALNGGDPGGALPFDVWGLLAHACPTVGHARELTLRHGVRDGFHVALADAAGGVLGVEAGQAGYAFLEPDAGMYVHANHMLSGPPLEAHAVAPYYGWDNSRFRQARMQACLDARRGQWDAAGLFAVCGDHEGYPDSLCSDRRAGDEMTTAAVVADPTHRRLLVSAGLPCQHPPREVSI